MPKVDLPKGLEYTPPLLGIAGGLLLWASLGDSNPSWDTAQRIVGGVLIVTGIGLFIYLLRNGAIKRLAPEKLFAAMGVGGLCATFSNHGAIEIVGLAITVFGLLALLLGFNYTKDEAGNWGYEHDEPAAVDS